MVKHKKVPIRDAIVMLSEYARSRIIAQVKSVAFIIIYLVIFQILILRVPFSNALVTAGGIALVIFGLAFFLEGLVLGFMPLGERVGVKLPARTGIIVISIFGLILGFGTTLAEPEIAALRTAGLMVTAWDSPLLYMLLEQYADWVVFATGIGVGIAVAMGMFRFYFNIPIKPFILIVVPVCLAATIYFSFDTNLNQTIGLAWDCGAVTTGAVTVPLVLALGIGVSRTASKGKGTSKGFGVILLASVVPVLTVFALAYVLNFKAPGPTTEVNFFSPAGREKALMLFDSEADLMQHAFSHGSEAGRRAFFSDDGAYRTAILSLQDDEAKRSSLLGTMSLEKWIIENASDEERDLLSDVELSGENDIKYSFGETLREESLGGIRAVIPLTLLLVIVLLGFLREKLRYKDEVILGIIFSLIGMTLLTAGIKLGLATLGSEVGAQLPRAFAREEKFVDRVVIRNFNRDLLYNTIAPDGTRKTWFNYMEDNKMRPIEFHPQYFNETTQTYEHIITRPPLFGSKLSVLGIILVLVFAFGMGYGATLAEPALSALGMTVEGITVGTIKRMQIVQVVSIGVGIGMIAGICRILFNLPLVWLIVGSYIILLPLTLLSEEEFTSIAWDGGGVTTGPVTVPLVLAMGLSIGGALNISDGFGVLALASSFPILTALLFGLFTQAKQRRSIRTSKIAAENE